MSDNQYFSEMGVGDPPLEPIPPPHPREVSSQVPFSGLLTARSAEEMTSRIEYPPRNLSALNVETNLGCELSSSSGRRNNQYFSAKDAGDPPPEFIPPPHPREVSSEVPFCGFLATTSAEEMTSRMEYPPRNLPALNVETNSGCELSSSSGRRDGTGLLSIGSYGNNLTSNVLPSGRDADIRIGQEFLSSRQDQDSYLREGPLDKRVVDIANQLLLANLENNPQEENSGSTSFLSLNDISMEYLQLYNERRPENYDFAMNIMAYIELLNDSSWKATVSYFDENVKKMIKHIWEAKKGIFDNTVDLRTFNRGRTLKFMLDFTQWSINEVFDFGQFLNYCILMCQLGVIGRKHIFKEASLYAIGQLRERIKLLKFENLVQFMFEIVVKEYAKRL